MKNIKNMIRNVVRRALIKREDKDDRDFPVQQVEYLDKAANCEIITPYGVHANLPANDEVLLTMWAVAGQEDYRVGMGYTPKLRPKDLPVGEVVFYHPLSQSKMQYKNNGDIEIDVIGENGSFLITVKKDLKITVAGDVTFDVTGTSTVNVPTTNWTGDINLTGNLDVSGNTTLGATVTSNGKDISDTHKHAGSPTAPDGPVSNTGAVS